VARKREVVFATVSPEVKEAVERVAQAMGISLSEYVRRLILEDLDKRSFFTQEAKKP